MDHSCGTKGKATMLKDGKFFRLIIVQFRDHVHLKVIQIYPFCNWHLWESFCLIILDTFFFFFGGGGSHSSYREFPYLSTCISFSIDMISEVKDSSINKYFMYIG